MANILFVQDIFFEHHGVEILSAVLKAAGHRCDALIAAAHKRNLLDSIRAIHPDLVAFSVMSIRADWAVRQALAIKEALGTRTLLGGPHATFAADALIHAAGVDMVCVGEGEGALVDLAHSIDAGWQGHEHIANLQVRTAGGVIANPVRRLVERLDDLPVQDRTIYYDRYPLLARLPVKRFIVGRGCPYDCAFCSNHAYRQLYSGNGKYCRKRSPASVIAEIEAVAGRYGARLVTFSDDTFTTDREYLYALLDLYGRRIGIPFHCHTRVNEVDEDVVKRLKQAGCRTVAFGIESANETIRNAILRKHVATEQIVRAASLFRSRGIRVTTYNMIGLPGEAMEDAFATLELNATVRADVPVVSMYQPLPGTDLMRDLQSRGANRPEPLAPGIPGSAAAPAIVAELANLERLFDLGVMFPRLIPAIRRLVRLPANPVFDLVRFATLAWKTRRRSGMGLFTTARLAVKLRNMA